MAGTSSTEHLRLPDDTVVVVRRFDGPRSRCIFIIPDFGRVIGEYERLCTTLTREATVCIMELRGHGLSEGAWSHIKERSDIEHILTVLKHTYHHVAVVAHGFSASIMLERESTANAVRPDALVLIAPRFAASEKFFKTHRRVHEHHGPFHLPPVRVTTPAVMLLHGVAPHHVSGVYIRQCVPGIETIATVRDWLRTLEQEGAIRAR